MNTMVVKVEATILWQFRSIGSGTRWMAVCEPLQLAVEALSRDELPGMINETLQLVLTDLLRENELDGFLREHGWTAKDLHKVGPTDDVEFDIPWTSDSRGSSVDIPRVLN